VGFQTLFIEDNVPEKVHQYPEDLQDTLREFKCPKHLALHVYFGKHYLTDPEEMRELLKPHSQRLERLVLRNACFPKKSEQVSQILDLCPNLTHLGVLSPTIADHCSMRMKLLSQQWEADICGLIVDYLIFPSPSFPHIHPPPSNHINPQIRLDRIHISHLHLFFPAPTKAPPEYKTKAQKNATKRAQQKARKKG